MRIMTFSAPGLMLFYHADLMLNPCLPVHLAGYWLVKEQCGGQIGANLQATWSASEVRNKLVVLFLNYFNWSFLLSGYTLHLSLGLLLKSHCLSRYILLAGKHIRGNYSKGDVQFWNTCVILREIQVISNEYRRIYSKYMTAYVLISIIVVHITSLYGCIHFGFELPLPMFLLFLLATIDSGTIIVVMYTSLANVFKASTHVFENELKQGKGSTVHQKYYWFRKYLKSCQIVRVFVGDTNFVEKLTPLVVEKFAIDQTISLVLVKK